MSRCRHLKMRRCKSHFGVDLGDNVHEFLEADDAVSVLIGVVDHLVDFGGGEVFPDAGSGLFEVLGAEGAAAGGIEGFEDGLEGAFAGAVAVEAEDGEEGGEVDVAGVSGVVDDGDDLSGLGFEVEGADGVDEFVGGDVATAVVVEHVEHFLQLLNGLSVQAFRHELRGVESFCGGGGGNLAGHKIFPNQQILNPKYRNAQIEIPPQRLPLPPTARLTRIARGGWRVLGVSDCN